MTAPESLRDRLARRAREIRTDAARRMLDREDAAAVAADIGAARALEEIVAALDAVPDLNLESIGVGNGRRSERERRDGVLGAWNNPWGGSP